MALGEEGTRKREWLEEGCNIWRRSKEDVPVAVLHLLVIYAILCDILYLLTCVSLSGGVNATFYDWGPASMLRLETRHTSPCKFLSFIFELKLCSPLLHWQCVILGQTWHCGVPLELGLRAGCTTGSRWVHVSSDPISSDNLGAQHPRHRLRAPAGIWCHSWIAQSKLLIVVDISPVIQFMHFKAFMACFSPIFI